MANQRPIRRGRVPFRRGRRWISARRPKRWNAALTPVDSELARFTSVFLTPGVNAQAPLATLVSGQVDVEPWADEQEVTLDRTIGNISLKATTTWDSAVTIDPPDVYVKLGILVNEEITADPAGSTLNMFEQETLEDYEWMWLWGGFVGADQFQTRALTGTQFVTSGWTNIYLDISNRRKIGQSDELNLFGQVVVNGETLGAPIVEAVYDLRTVLMSK